MDPLLIGGGLGLGSSLLGGIFGGDDREKANQLIQQTLHDYDAIGVPPIEAQKLLLEELKSAGKLTPELEEMVVAGPSKMGDISLDPGYKAAQMKALDELSSIGSSGGLRLSDQAAIEEALGKVRSQERGSREAILANARERGVSGGGSELAAQLANQQNSAENAYKSGLGVAAIAEDRALDAIIKGGQLAGDIRKQEFGEKSDVARAQDEIDRFNAENRIDIGSRNVANKNAAQERNLNEAQRIMDTNTGLRNDEQKYNKGLYQTNFGNQLDLASGKSNARAGQANNLNKNADSTQQMWGGIGQGINQLGTTMAITDAMKRKKED